MPSTISAPLGGKLLRPRFMPETIENAVHNLRLLLGEERVGDIDIFGNDHARRHVAANQDLVGAGAKDRTQDRIDAGQPPAFGKLLVNQRIDAELLAHDALHEVAEESGLRLGVLAALDLAAE